MVHGLHRKVESTKIGGRTIYMTHLNILQLHPLMIDNNLLFHH